MVNTKVNLLGIELANPLIPASGTFGYGREFSELYDINCLGTFSFKGTTREPRYGNPTPRIAECPDGMLNSVGLQNPGVEHVIAHELPELRRIFRKPIIANISGFSIEEYVHCVELLTKEEQVEILEVNISCPNVRHGGMAFGTSPEAAAEVTRAVKAVATKPVYMKLSPNVTDIVAIARACEDAGADGLSLINTLLGMRIDRRGEDTGHRHGRRIHRPGRDRDDDGRRRRGTGGRGEPGESLRLPGHHRAAARGNGEAGHRPAVRHHPNLTNHIKEEHHHGEGRYHCPGF